MAMSPTEASSAGLSYIYLMCWPWEFHRNPQTTQTWKPVCFLMGDKGKDSAWEEGWVGTGRNRWRRSCKQDILWEKKKSVCNNGENNNQWKKLKNKENTEAVLSWQLLKRENLFSPKESHWAHIRAGSMPSSRWPTQRTPWGFSGVPCLTALCQELFLPTDLLLICYGFWFCSYRFPVCANVCFPKSVCVSCVFFCSSPPICFVLFLLVYIWWHLILLLLFLLF